MSQGLKLLTAVDAGHASWGFSYSDNMLLMGSCFAAEIGSRMQNYAFNVNVNPFGALYNPLSLVWAMERLACGKEFDATDTVQLGAGSSLVCSHHHHTSFARESTEEFLANANAELARAAKAFSECNLVILTLGTSWCYRLKSDGSIAGNCLKRPASEFERFFLSSQETFEALSGLAAACRDKRFIFTVSPVRHLADGAHGNQLSKASLLLAVDRLCKAMPDRVEYFPAYEIVMDELRDYRFYAEDMVHPSAQAADYIWSRFCDWGLPESDRGHLDEAVRAWKSSRHRPLAR